MAAAPPPYDRRTDARPVAAAATDRPASRCEAPALLLAVRATDSRPPPPTRPPAHRRSPSWRRRRPTTRPHAARPMKRCGGAPGTASTHTHDAPSRGGDNCMVPLGGTLRPLAVAPQAKPPTHTTIVAAAAAARPRNLAAGTIPRRRHRAASASPPTILLRPATRPPTTHHQRRLQRRHLNPDGPPATPAATQPAKPPPPSTRRRPPHDGDGNRLRGLARRDPRQSLNDSATNGAASVPTLACVATAAADHPASRG